LDAAEMTLKVIRVLFTILVMTFITVLVIIAFGYDRESALLPLLVGGTSLVLGGLVIASEISPKVQGMFMTNLFQIGATKKDSESIRALNFGLTSFWVILLLLLIFIFGFLSSLPVWIFCYIRFQGLRPWSHALITSVSIWLFLYGFFVRIMNLDLFQGILFGGRI
jgi:hypothetical protein